MQYKEKTIKVLNIMLLVAVVFILLASLEALMLAKSIEAYEGYKELVNEATYNNYLGLVIVNFFMTIIDVLLISLFIYFTRRKVNITSVVKFLFAGIILIKWINIFLRFTTDSIFYYLYLIILIIFMICIVILPNKRRN